MTNCKNCDNPIIENYCSKCGHAAKLKRIDKHYISHEFLHLLHFEKGFIYTAKALLLNPGESMRKFINSDRNKLMKPITFLILTSLLYTIVAHLFHADQVHSGPENAVLEKSSIGTIIHWIQAHYGYANIISGIFYSLCIMLFFRKYNYNFYEISVIICFIMGQQMLLLTIATFFFPLMSYSFYGNLILIISLLYPIYPIGHFFDKAKAGSYIKAFLAYLLGNIMWFIAVIIVGVGADIIIRLFMKH